MKELLYYSILTFPQYYKDGKIDVNILLIPRNLNPLSAIKDGMPAFADTRQVWNIKIISSLNGLPVYTHARNGTLQLDPVPGPENLRKVWEGLKAQFELHEQMIIDDEETHKASQRAEEPNAYKAIRKYLPLTYRRAFNFVQPRTKYALTDDSYHCSVQNKTKNKDKSTARDKISWGKVIAYCLRNPYLAKKAGLLFSGTITLEGQNEDLIGNGGWIFADFDPGHEHTGVERALYAARIPVLKDVDKRNLFSAVQFRVSETAQNVNAAAHDTLMKESILYDDGFAKIVHANQPVNQDILQESDKSNPPVKDIGIRLGWEDEQITIWYNRQMQQADELTGTKVDAPLGIFGYRIDVREAGKMEWLSQNMVVNPDPVILPQHQMEIIPAHTSFEPGYEVFPAAHGDARNDGFWLPMYFAGWIGKTMTIADRDAEEINLLKAEYFNTTNQPYSTDAALKVPKPAFHPYVQAPDHVLSLRYGRAYEFRVRLMDITGGGPAYNDQPLHGGDNPVEHHHFRRYIQAGPVIIENVKEYFDQGNTLKDSDTLADPSVLQNITDTHHPGLRIKRPLLAYPAVVFTGKYNQTNVVERLKRILRDTHTDQPAHIEIGLPDPDVTHMMIRVEARSLAMDNGLSLNGKESYIPLYEKEFELPADIANENYDEAAEIKIIYRDIPDIHLGETFPMPEDTAADELVLPTARHLRIGIYPLLKNTDDSYRDDSVATGKPIFLTAYQVSEQEEHLLSHEQDNLKAVYLQPDDALRLIGVKPTAEPLNYLLTMDSNTPIELSRLADTLDLAGSRLTLQGKKGKRVQFGCSSMMRHTLAPDCSSITFSALDELFRHWILPLDFNLERDWAWDGLAVQSISVYRSWKVDEQHYGQEELAGRFSISDTANIYALQQADRSKTRIIFLDAFDPKVTVKKFPREFDLSYRIVVHFKEAFQMDDLVIHKHIHLPITIHPHQVPQLVSAGLALSPYRPDPDKYRYTEPRRKYLWFEMEEPVSDPLTTYYVRVTANAPDPLLSRVTQEMIQTDIKDLPIPLDSEKIRTVITGMQNDYAGMGVMQAMQAEELSTGKASIYLVPLPEGLHSDSDELFGFFTYEVRVGYKEDVWSTAQGRYGSPLKVNGVQHPAPNLHCTAMIKNIFKPGKKMELHTVPEPEPGWVDRLLAKEVLYSRNKEKRKDIKEEEIELIRQEFDKRAGLEDKLDLVRDKLGRDIKPGSGKVIVVNAPYAAAVHNGKNITANPPQTSIWYLLYTQVLQADGKSYRNLLLDSGMLHPPRLSDRGGVKKERHHYEAGPGEGIPDHNERKEGKILGTAIIPLIDIKQKLELLGLPGHSDISVLCVEMFPMNPSWQMSDIHTKSRYYRTQNPENRYEEISKDAPDRLEVTVNPLTDLLGSYRIYRTSPLVPLASGCCDDC